VLISLTELNELKIQAALKSMPKKMEMALKKQAKKKGLSKKAAGAYIYGTIAKYEKRKKGKS